MKNYEFPMRLKHVLETARETWRVWPNKWIQRHDGKHFQFVAETFLFPLKCLFSIMMDRGFCSWPVYHQCITLRWITFSLYIGFGNIKRTWLEMSQPRPLPKRQRAWKLLEKWLWSLKNGCHAIVHLGIQAPLKCRFWILGILRGKTHKKPHKTRLNSMRKHWELNDNWLNFKKNLTDKVL